MPKYIVTNAGGTFTEVYADDVDIVDVGEDTELAFYSSGELVAYFNKGCWRNFVREQ